MQVSPQNDGVKFAQRLDDDFGPQYNRRKVGSFLQGWRAPRKVEGVCHFCIDYLLEEKL